jgi:hypothetical protein
MPKTNAADRLHAPGNAGKGLRGASSQPPLDIGQLAGVPPQGVHIREGNLAVDAH